MIRHTSGHCKMAGLKSVSDDIGNKRQDRYQNTLIDYVAKQTARKDAVCRFSGWTAHGVRFCFLHSQSQCGEAVGNQVDKQQMYGIEQRKAHQGRPKDTKHLAHVGCQQKLNGFADIVVDPAPLVYRRNDGGEVVVCQNHICHIFRDIRTGDAHSDANVRRFDGRCIINSVARHCGNGTKGFPRAYNAGFVLRLNARINAVSLYGLPKLCIGNAIQFCARNGLRGI